MSEIQTENLKNAAYTQGPNNYGAIAHFYFIISKAEMEKIFIEHKMFTSISFDILSENFFAPITLLASHTRDGRGKVLELSIVNLAIMLQWPTHRVSCKFLHRYSICCRRKRRYCVRAQGKFQINGLLLTRSSHIM